MTDEVIKPAEKSVTVTRIDGARATEPHPDPEFAEKGASTPAPIPEHKLPNRDKEMKKARAILEGKDPAVVAAIDEAKDGDELVTVAKEGETLEVHPDALDAHVAAGWRVVEKDDGDRESRRDRDAGKVVKAAESEVKAKADDRIGKRHDAAK